MRLLFALLLLSFVTACSHPLEIVGEGDIVSSTGINDCSLEEQPCDNLVAGNYNVTYTAEPHAGWNFVCWEGCGDQFPDCSFDVPGRTVDQYWGQVMPPLRAIFSQEVARNVLIILDNTANWNTAFENEKDVLVATFEDMEPNAFNVGLMMFGESPDLGYVRAAIRPMSDMVPTYDPYGVTYNQLYADMIGEFTRGDDGGNARTLARTFSEAYQYLQGDVSGEPSNSGTGGNEQRDYFENYEGSNSSQIVHALPGNAFEDALDFSYTAPPEPGVCARTYIIYIGNAGPGGNVTTDNSARNAKSKNDLEVAATAAGVSPTEATALITSGYAYTAHQGNYADEWARFMHDHHDVIFYAVDVDPPPHPEYDGLTGHSNGMSNSELLRSLSEGVGGGKYYRVGSADPNDPGSPTLQGTFDDIFIEIRVGAAN